MVKSHNGRYSEWYKGPKDLLNRLEEYRADWEEKRDTATQLDCIIQDIVALIEDSVDMEDGNANCD